MSTLVPVRLLDLPVQLHARAQQRSDALHREFRLVVEQARDDATSVPARLLEISTTLSGRYEGFTEAQEELLELAVAEGVERLPELRFDVPRHGGEAAAALDALLDEADTWCRDGAMLVLAAPADVIAYRRWYLHCFVTQCAGAEPVPWPGPWE